eukprot:6579168-Alexandrium_andersonii.AAC.1
MSEDMRGGVDHNWPIARNVGRQAEVCLMPSAHWAPVDRPFGVSGARHRTVTYDGRPGDGSLAGPRPRSDGGVRPR